MCGVTILFGKDRGEVERRAAAFRDMLGRRGPDCQRCLLEEVEMGKEGEEEEGKERGKEEEGEKERGKEGEGKKRGKEGGTLAVAASGCA